MDGPGGRPSTARWTARGAARGTAWGPGRVGPGLCARASGRPATPQAQLSRRSAGSPRGPRGLSRGRTRAATPQTNAGVGRHPKQSGSAVAADPGLRGVARVRALDAASSETLGGALAFRSAQGVPSEGPGGSLHTLCFCRLLRKSKNQAGDRPRDTRTRRRARVYLTPTDPDELLRQSWVRGPGLQGSYRERRRPGSEGCADCGRWDGPGGAGAALRGTSGAGSPWREAGLQEQKRLAVSCSR